MDGIKPLIECKGVSDWYLQVNGLITKVNYDVAMGWVAKLFIEELIDANFIRDTKDSLRLLSRIGFQPVMVLVFEREDGVQYSDFKRIEVGCMQIPF